MILVKSSENNLRTQTGGIFTGRFFVPGKKDFRWFPFVYFAPFMVKEISN